MKKLINIIYPPFSEIDAFVLLVALLIPVFFNAKTFDNLAGLFDEYGLGIILFVYVGTFILWSYLVIKNILIKKTLTKNEKYQLATYFYIIIGVLTLVSAYTIFNLPYTSFFEFTLFEKINLFIVIFLFIRALFSLATLKAIESYKHIIINQVEDIQANLVEIVLIIITAVLVYFLFLTEYSIAAGALLTYFYSSTVVKVLKSTVIKNLFPS